MNSLVNFQSTFNFKQFILVIISVCIWIMCEIMYSLLCNRK